MAYQIFQSGVVGRSDNIGGSSDYHIDSKFSTSLGASKAREMFEEKVKRYNTDGRSVEFSNQGVAGSIYDMSLPLEKRQALFDKAAAAHAPREGFYSLDYYAPNKGTNRFDKSAETANIYGVAPIGGKAVPGIGGNYGYHNMIYNADGELIAKVGHGDKTKAGSMDSQTFGEASSITPAATVDNVETSRVEAKTKAQSYKDMSATQLNEEYDRLRAGKDVNTAQAAGLAMHKAHFNKP